MNKDLNTFGIILFFISIFVFAVFTLTWYIPHIQADITNPNYIMTALWWGVGCGITGTIGLLMARAR